MLKGPTNNFVFTLIRKVNISVSVCSAVVNVACARRGR